MLRGFFIHFFYQIMFMFHKLIFRFIACCNACFSFTLWFLFVFENVFAREYICLYMFFIMYRKPIFSLCLSWFLRMLPNCLTKKMLMGFHRSFPAVKKKYSHLFVEIRSLQGIQHIRLIDFTFNSLQSSRRRQNIFCFFSKNCCCINYNCL